MIAYAGMFNSEGEASSASNELQTAGFRPNEILLLSPSGDNQAKVLTQAQTKGFLSDVTRRRVETELGNGKHFTVVRAPLGSGLKAIEVLTDKGANILPAAIDSPFPRFVSQLGGAPMLYRIKPQVDVIRRRMSVGIPLLVGTPKGGRSGGYGGLQLLTGRRNAGENAGWGGLPLLKKGFMDPVFPLLWKKRSK